MRQRNPETSRGREQPWLLRQFIRPVQPHIGEGFTFPQSLVIAGIIALMLVSFIVLYNLVGRALGPGNSPKATAPAGVPISTTAATRSSATTAASTRSPGGSPVPTVAGATVPPTAAQPTQAPMGATVAPTPAGGTKYKVKAGDTLSSIAAKFNVSVQAIMTANNMKSDAIYAGEELVIPPSR